MQTATPTTDMTNVLASLGLEAVNFGTSTGTDFFGNTSNNLIASYSPVDGQLIGKVTTTTKEEYERVMASAQEAYKTWRLVPAPQRGEIVRQYGEALRIHKDALGRLVSLRNGQKPPRRLGRSPRNDRHL